MADHKPVCHRVLLLVSGVEYVQTGETSAQLVGSMDTAVLPWPEGTPDPGVLLDTVIEWREARLARVAADGPDADQRFYDAERALHHCAARAVRAKERGSR